MTAHKVVTEQAAAMRLRGEFLALPGLRLTVPQVARLLGIRQKESSIVLTALEREGLLIRMEAGAYRLASPPMS